MGTTHPDTVEDVREIAAGLGRHPGRVLVIDASGVLFDNVTENSPFLERIAARLGVAPDALRCGYDARSGAFETGKLSVPAALDASTPLFPISTPAFWLWHLARILCCASRRPMASAKP